MKNRVCRAARLLLACLLWVTCSAHALTLADLRGAVVIGRSLDVTVPVYPAEGEMVSGDCVAVDVWYADNRQTNVRVSVTPPGSGAQSAIMLRVQVAAYVNEPMVTVVVHATCGSSTQRRFEVLADFPTITNLAALSPPTVAAAPVLVLPPQVPVVPSAEAAPAKPVRGKKPKATQAEASAQHTAQAGQPMATKRTKTVARAAGKAVLKLDPLDILSDRMDTLDAAMVFAPSEDAVLNSKKIASLEENVKTLQVVATRSEATLAELRTQLRQAQDNQVPAWVVEVVGLLLLVCMAALVWLMLQQRRLAQDQALSEWWKDRAPDSEVHDDEFDLDSLHSSPSVLGAASGHAHFSTPSTSSGPSTVQATLPQTLPPTKNEAVFVSPFRVLDFDLDEMTLPLPHHGAAQANTHSPPVEAGSIRHISVEPILDIRQQAEFFVSLGQSDRALSILKKHTTESAEPNPLVYLDLITLYHTLGMRVDYHECSVMFRHLFNGVIPDFSDFTTPGRGIEDYPEVLNKLVSLWPRTEVLVFLNACIFHDPQTQTGQTFELTAFRDLLMLDAMAETLTA